MAEENEKANIIRDAVKDARDILKEPIDLGKLPLSKLPLSKGRLPENWAGKLFSREYIEEFDSEGFREKIEFVPRRKEELRPTPEHRVVPLVIYRDGTVDDEHRTKIGTAKVYPDGSFTAELNEGTVLEDADGLLGPFSDRAFSFGMPVDINRIDEVNVDSGGRPTPPKSYWIADFNDIKERDL